MTVLWDKFAPGAAHHPATLEHRVLAARPGPVPNYSYGRTRRAALSHVLTSRVILAEAQLPESECDSIIVLTLLGPRCH